VKNQPHSQSLVSAIKSSDFEISVHYWTNIELWNDLQKVYDLQQFDADLKRMFWIYQLETRFTICLQKDLIQAILWSRFLQPIIDSRIL
jgi:hypothetical protein